MSRRNDNRSVNHIAGAGKSYGADQLLSGFPADAAALGDRITVFISAMK